MSDKDRMKAAAGAPAAAEAPERRSVPRSSPSVACKAVLLAGSSCPDAAVEDVSPRGLKLRLPAAAGTPDLERGSEINLRIEWQRRSIERVGLVAWVGRRPDGQWNIGVRFLVPADAEEVPALLDMKQVRIDPVWALRVPANLAIRRQILPFSCVDGEVRVACANAADAVALKALERYIHMPLRPQQAEPESLRRVLQKVYGDNSAAADTDDPAALCHEFLYAAWLRQASDIHIDPETDGVRVRLRVDGQLEDYRRLPSNAHAELISRIKVLGGMDIAEKRAPQDGRFTQEFGMQRRVDIRVATLPTKYGERLTLRLLAIQMETLTLENLGMSPRDLAIYERSFQRPHGMLLATGPTGCGKTSTLYAALRRIIAIRPVNAISVQDPIEYDIPGVAQVEVDSAQKLTFAKALRSILRHDPDVLMIGEIRDRETVDIAIKAALTGHLVLATLHTNSAASAVTRLRDMDVESYLIAATLRLVVAQRLVRRLCAFCRRGSLLSAAQARSLGRPAAERMEIFEPRGCVYCAGRGYNGRIGLFELLPLEEEWSRAIAAGIEEGGLVEMMRRHAMPSILDDALEKMQSGATSLHEILAAAAT